jgi:hypothetical protein
MRAEVSVRARRASRSEPRQAPRAREPVSRSTYVYIAISGDGSPLKACTVKREMHRWLASRKNNHLIQLFRMRDGIFVDPPVQLNPDTMEPAI